MNGNSFFSKQAITLPAQHLMGGTLTEVLVTVVILNLGMLTAARMLNDSLHLLADSGYQQRAIRLAADLTALLSNTRASLASSTSTPDNHNCEYSICSPQQFLEHSLHYWNLRATQLLPDGSIGLELQTSGQQTLALITVRWTPRGSLATSHRTQTILLPDL